MWDRARGGGAPKLSGRWGKRLMDVIRITGIAPAQQRQAG